MGLNFRLVQLIMEGNFNWARIVDGDKIRLSIKAISTIGWNYEGNLLLCRFNCTAVLYESLEWSRLRKFAANFSTHANLKSINYVCSDLLCSHLTTYFFNYKVVYANISKSQHLRAHKFLLFHFLHYRIRAWRLSCHAGQVTLGSVRGHFIVHLNKIEQKINESVWSRRKEDLIHKNDSFVLRGLFSSGWGGIIGRAVECRLHSKSPLHYLLRQFLIPNWSWVV